MRKLLSLDCALVVGWLCFVGCTSEVVVQTVSDRTGLGMVGIRVQVDEQPWATTDNHGMAKFAAVQGTFTVRVHQTFAASPPFEEIFVLEGQSQREVLVEVDGNPGTFLPPHLPGWYDAEISGAVQGRTQPPSAASTRVGVYYRNTTLFGFVADDGGFDFNTLVESPAASVSLRAYEGRNGSFSDTITDLFAFGSATVPVASGGRTTGVSVALQPVTKGTVEASALVAAPLAGADVRAYTYIGFGRYEPEAVTFDRTTVAPTGFSFPVYAAQGAVTGMVLDAYVPGVGSAFHRRRVSVPETGVTFQLVAPVELVEPADGATIDATTVFRWSGSGNGGHATLELSCYPPGARYVVTTTASQTNLPSIPGVALPSGAHCTWWVWWHSAIAPSVEEYTTKASPRTATAR